jgi:DNA-binding protein H-NS
MSLKELTELRDRIAVKIRDVEENRKAAEILDLVNRAKDLGFTMQDLFPTASIPRKRSPSTAKYANPDNKSQTWSGRGRKPGWFINALANGTSPGDLAV